MKSTFFTNLSDRIADRIATLVAPLREQITASLDGLQPRERVIVAVGVVVVIATILYAAIWHPAVKARQEAETRLADARAIAVQLEKAGSVARSPGSHVSGGGGSLLTVVDQAARTSDIGKTPRLQPDGENAVRVWFENVPFDNLARWMAQLESKYGVKIDAVDVEHQATPGVVNARLSIGRGA